MAEFLGLIVHTNHLFTVEENASNTKNSKITEDM